MAKSDPKSYMLLGELYDRKSHSYNIRTKLNCEISPEPSLAAKYYAEAARLQVSKAQDLLAGVCEELKDLDRLKASKECGF